MGTLTTTNKTAAWLDRVDAARTGLIEASGSGNRVAAAFATAEARMELIESLKDPEISAKLLKMTDPQIAMVELANDPTDQDRIRVCAIAILSGFCPGDDQFAIFGGKGGGKLYTKEAGFRTLFAHLGIVPELWVGHPEFVPLGTSGKKVWRVEGKVLCTWKGKQYIVDCTGRGQVGLPGYESDNVAGIQAKARRRLLQQLWAKVSPILTEDHADTFDEVIQPEAAAIENTPPAPQSTSETTDRERQKLAFDQWHLVSQRRITNAEQLATVNKYWMNICGATTKTQVKAIAEELAKTQVKPLGKNNVDELLRFCVWCEEGFPEGDAP